MRQVESTDFPRRLIHGDVCTEDCKVAVGAFVLAIVGERHFRSVAALKFLSAAFVQND